MIKEIWGADNSPASNASQSTDFGHESRVFIRDTTIRPTSERGLESEESQTYASYPNNMIPQYTTNANPIEDQ